MASEATSTEHSSSGSLNFIACSNFVTEVKQEENYIYFVTLKEKKRKQSEAGLKRRLSVWVLFEIFFVSRRVDLLIFIHLICTVQKKIVK